MANRTITSSRPMVAGYSGRKLFFPENEKWGKNKSENSENIALFLVIFRHLVSENMKINHEKL